MAEELLSYQEVEKALDSIIHNKFLVQVKSRDRSEFLIFCHPTSDEIIQSRCVREKALLEAQSLGLPSLEELQGRLDKSQIISPADQEKIKKLEEQITGQKRVLQLTKIEGRRKTIFENIERMEKEIDEVRSKGEDLLLLSAEKKADEEALLYLAWSATYDVYGDKYWATFRDFENETDIIFRAEVIAEFAKFNQGQTTKTLRYLARHSLWRIRYTSALKIGGSLFERGLEDLTPDQLALLYWSNYYQSIYEMLPDDQPDSDTINDDEALDAYMERYFKQKEQERNEGKVKRQGAGNKKKLSAWDRGEELIITANHPEYMNMAYTEERVKAEGASDVEVIAPNSRRARNRAQARRNRR